MFDCVIPTLLQEADGSWYGRWGVNYIYGTWQVLRGLRALNIDMTEPWLLNVNVPSRAHADLLPVRVCRLGRRHAAERVTTQANPRGETMYWIGGAGPAKDDAEGTDFHASALGHVTLTPLQVDLSDHARLPYWAQSVSAWRAR